MGRLLVVLFLITLSACAPRGRLAYLDHPDPQARAIFVGSTRAPDPVTGQPFGFERSPELRLARFDVATPPDRQTAQIDYPTTGGTPTDPKTQFMISQAQIDLPRAQFQSELRTALRQNKGEAVVFVHGFNNSFAEGLYRMAQMGEDFDLPGVMVHYAWPSRANVLGYAYDRDSVLFARDGLAELLGDLRAAGARRIMLVAHSLGTELTMEVLRQEAIAHEQGLFSSLGGVILISPDIAVDVFQTQADAIGTLPQPFVIFTSQKDRALQLSARLTGQSDRLGNLEDLNRIARYKVTVVNVSAFNTGDGHFNVVTSPELIRLLDSTGQIAKVLEGDQRGRTGLGQAVILTVENATQIVLAPISGG
ncbi:MAG: alpha/beta fold hydrolase [Rhodobacteraceae bacterium]|jgi:Uncharacterized protein conserved in bacteria|nr:hypothetical protein BMI90_04560 [Thioclava sp. L04-15]TNE94376.1 MAG: alpha/beta fold hydrolase [Paracoccaceae bacterium]TNF16734.1 MAG: alpha/beta fold hydrolase [Paracoccaceae bacterium]